MMSVSVDMLPYRDFCPLMARDNRHRSPTLHGTVKIGMAKRFRDAFLEALTSTGTSVTKVAAATGVSEGQLKKLKQRENASTNVDDAIKVANFFGYTLDEFLGDQTVQDRAEVVSLYNQLSARERAILRAAALATDDADQEGGR